MLQNILTSKTISIVFFLTILLIPILGANSYHMFIATIMLIHVILALGLNILMGYAGQLAFANAAIFGIGAYGFGLLQKHLGIPLWFGAPISALAAMAIGTLLVLPALRLSGIYLALATIAFAQCAVWVMVHWVSLTNGAGGFTIRPLDFSPLPILPEHGVYYLTWICCVLLLWSARNIVQSPIGRAWVALRDHELAAQCLGINLFNYRALAFAISALYAGIAGVLYAAALSFVGPDSFGLQEMVIQLAAVVVGGSASIVGSVVGGIGIVFVQEAAKETKFSIEIVFGLLLSVFVLFQPAGLVSLLRYIVPGYRERLHWQAKSGRSKAGANTKGSAP